MPLRDFEIETLQLLSFLYEQKDYAANRSAIKNNVNASTETIYQAIEVLQKKGLIDEVAMSNMSQEKRIFLTEKGIVAAKKLSEIREIIKAVEKEFRREVPKKTNSGIGLPNSNI
jgi:DNA-binding PadR family transcriptional regulator